MYIFKAKPWLILTVIITIALISLNAYFVFKGDSKVPRTYFIDEFQRATAKHRVDTVKKEAIVVPANTYTISADATSLASISVQRGQTIHANDLLATYETAEADHELTKLESERTAYKNELHNLQEALTQIDTMNPREKNPKSTIDAKQVRDQLNVTVKLELAQQTTPSEAIAILQRHIAETTRQIAITEAQIAQMQARQGIVSPVDGVISAISTEAGTVTFEIYTADKALFTYITKDEWQKVQEGQTIELHIPFVEEKLTGTVVQKQPLPVDKTSLWANELGKASTNGTYEVMLQQDEPLENIPYATIGQTSIIINEAFDAYQVDTAWIKSTKKHPYSVYILDEDGKIRLEDIEPSFTTANATIFSSDFDEGTPIMMNNHYPTLARSFVSMPIKKIEWQHFKELSWKRYVKYMLF
ncbi:HlyD family secretion protein [Lysinibacillus piscis]|uniref:HlyD family secretion protein n=1 Tax=Lysinibacillus piscis TaxID=2518931 RepID=A0ABQ5NHN5_9BACI|nr:HlyD family secretion protein [Lysinibacillus sp. KH24]GLC87866.1 hypothetical protein LYSBPC_09930 [Lysinibacillus sp. KH24]